MLSLLHLGFFLPLSNSGFEILHFFQIKLRKKLTKRQLEATCWSNVASHNWKQL